MFQYNGVFAETNFLIHKTCRALNSAYYKLSRDTQPILHSFCCFPYCVRYFFFIALSCSLSQINSMAGNKCLLCFVFNLSISPSANAAAQRTTVPSYSEFINKLLIYFSDLDLYLYLHLMAFNEGQYIRL